MEQNDTVNITANSELPKNNYPNSNQQVLKPPNMGYSNKELNSSINNPSYGELPTHIDENKGFLNECGIFMSIIYAAIIGTFFPVVMIILGITYLYNNGNVANGTITNVGNSNPNTDNTCNYQKLVVDYVVNGISYSGTPTNENEAPCLLNKGESVFVYYNVDNPATFTIQKYSKRYSGIMFIVFGVLFALFGWGVFLLSKYSNTFAKFFCLYGLISLF